MVLVCGNEMKLVLFDFDGVLVRSNMCHLQNMRASFEEAGIRLDVSDEEILRHFGMHYSEIIREIMPPEIVSAESVLAVSKIVERRINDVSYALGFERIDGLDEFLSALRLQHHVAIASGNMRSDLVRWAGAIGVDKHVDFMVGSDEVVRGKPEPDMIVRACEHFAVRPSDVVYVGDAKNDVLMARNAGVRSAVVLTGALSIDEARALRPDIIVPDVTKLEF